MELFGRREILTAVDKITQSNVVRVLQRAVGIHEQNSREIDYLYQYMRGNQPVLYRKKTIRPEILNKICENNAMAIVQFTASYFLGEPVTYVKRGDQSSSENINQLNDWMFFEDKASHDKDLATWMACCGQAYRMVLPDRYAGEDFEDDSPFELDTPDPRDTFVVYHSGFGHRKVMGVRRIWREPTADDIRCVWCGYTDTHYFEVENDVLKVWKPHALSEIPIFEYRLNMYRMGAFEAAIPLLDAINNIESNRVDGVESFVQSFLKFKNCEVDEAAVKQLSALGAIMIRSVDGLEGDVDIMSQELNQSQTQTLVDHLYQQVLTICGLPSTSDGNTATSDTGVAVELRNGWAATENRARDTEMLFKKSEKEFLRLVLKIVRGTRGMSLKLGDIECKFTRRQHDNLLTKTQSLLHMLEAGLNPEVAIATCGLFNDPMDVTAQSKAYLKKWEYVDPLEELEREAEITAKQTAAAVESAEPAATAEKDDAE